MKDTQTIRHFKEEKARLRAEYEEGNCSFERAMKIAKRVTFIDERIEELQERNAFVYAAELIDDLHEGDYEDKQLDLKETATFLQKYTINLLKKILVIEEDGALEIIEEHVNSDLFE